jgi:hypothetical protein
LFETEPAHLPAHPWEDELRARNARAAQKLAALPKDVRDAIGELMSNAAAEMAERVRFQLAAILRAHERRIGELERGARVVPEREVAARIAAKRPRTDEGAG